MLVYLQIPNEKDYTIFLTLGLVEETMVSISKTLGKSICWVFQY